MRWRGTCFTLTLVPRTPGNLALAFGLFRLLDIAAVRPIRFCGPARPRGLRGHGPTICWPGDRGGAALPRGTVLGTQRWAASWAAGNGGAATTSVRPRCASGTSPSTGPRCGAAASSAPLPAVGTTAAVAGASRSWPALCGSTWARRFWPARRFLRRSGGAPRRPRGPLHIHSQEPHLIPSVALRRSCAADCFCSWSCSPAHQRPASPSMSLCARCGLVRRVAVEAPGARALGRAPVRAARAGEADIAATLGAHPSRMAWPWICA